MIGILVTSHGGFCKELIQTGEMIVGKQENVQSVSLQSDGIDVFSQRLRETLNDMFNQYEAVLVLCDLKGGTPCNESLKYALTNNKKIKIIPGVNLPMYLEVVSITSFINDIDELEILAVNSGKDSIESIEI